MGRDLKNVKSGSPSTGPRRSLRLRRSFSREVTAKAPISSTPNVQAGDDFANLKAAGPSSSSSMRQSSSLEDAAITEENPNEIAARYDTLINERTQVEGDGEGHEDLGHQVDGSGNSGKRPNSGFRIDGDSVYQGESRNPRPQDQAYLLETSNPNEESKTIDLGGYDNEEEAARAQDLEALTVWGPSISMNFPADDYEKEMEEMMSLAEPEYKPRVHHRKSKGFAKGASSYRGVSRNSVSNKWQARLGKTKGERSVYLGTFASEEEAARAYDVAAIRLKGTRAITNFGLSSYDVQGICESDRIPIGDGASKWIRKTPVDEIILWRSRITSKRTSGTDTGSSSRHSLEAPPLEEESEKQADDPDVDAGDGLFKIRPDDFEPYVPVWVRNPSFEFLKDTEVPPSQIDLDCILHGPAGPEGGSLFAGRDAGSQEFALQDPKDFLPGASETLASPECHGSGFPISCPTEGCEGIDSQSDDPKLITAPVRSNGIYVGEYLRELFPEGNIPEVDWDKILSGEGTNENPIKGTPGSQFAQNPSSTVDCSESPNSREQPNGPRMTSHGSLNNDGTSMAVAVPESSLPAAAITDSRGAGQANGRTRSLNGFDGILPVTPEEFYNFGLYAGWLNAFLKEPGDDNGGSDEN